MTVLHACFLGILEGITEFLPISSTAHLILAGKLMHLADTEALKTFEIAIQSGAILAVLVMYGKKLLTNANAFYKVVTAFVPTAIIGLLLHKVVKNVLFESTSLILWALLIGGIVLILVEHTHKEKPSDASRIEDISYSQAFMIGIAQSLALIPGVSRAGATIVAGLLMQIKRQTIIEFSFLLAIPTMLAATGLDLLKSASAFSSNDWLLLAAGFSMAFLTALVAIQWLLQYIQRHSFTAFGIYRIAAALVLWRLV